MTVAADIAVIVCTRNRADSLARTLAGFASLDAPPCSTVELIVVDNGSNDSTRDVVRSSYLPNIRVRYVLAPSPGLSRARNAAMDATAASIMLWTDDDVHPPRDWIVRMSRPLINNEADAVSGRVRMAPQLERSWMRATHYVRLADTRFQGAEACSLTGANMGFHRRVAQRLRCFDTELGAGALGYGEDSLFSMIVAEAGFRVLPLPDVVVEHHFDEGRLVRSAWIDCAVAGGKSWAYIARHWRHSRIMLPRLKLSAWAAMYFVCRPCFALAARNTEGCTRHELRIIQNIAFLRQYLVEIRRPAAYGLRGLTKITGTEHSGSQPADGAAFTAPVATTEGQAHR